MSYFGIPTRNGVAAGLGSAAAIYSNNQWNPRYLFSNGEQGVWYDFSDFSTMYQDSTGTTPVTAVDQFVGLILDKSKGPALAPTLIINGDFSNGSTGWTLTVSAGITSNSVVDGKLTVVTQSGISQGSVAAQNITTVIGKTYILKMNTTSTLSSSIGIQVTGGTALYFAAGANSLVFTATATTTTVSLLAQPFNLVRTYTYDNISVLELPGNHASQATAIKRFKLGQDLNKKYYLLCDGSNDALSTGNVNFTSTNQMTVIIGLRKIGNSAAAVVELSASTNLNNGAFGVYAPDAGNDYTFASRGTIIATNSGNTGYAPPITNVLTCIANIAAPLNKLRVNGADVKTVTTSQGTGNYGNYPIYIGSRGGIDIPFNGYIYEIIVRGAASTSVEINNAEVFCNEKTGAY